MSFIITLYVREGIVMASDSRLTLNQTLPPTIPGGNQIVNLAVTESDNNYKTFLAPNNIGISTCGAADINGVPIAGYIESFIRENLNDDAVCIDSVPQLLSNYFQTFQPIPDVQFHVGGYKVDNGQYEQHVWRVFVATNSIEKANPINVQGAVWNGETDILIRLINPVGTFEHSTFSPLSFYQIPFQYFTLQDAIDFAIFAIRSTIDAIRFQPRPKTVGGPIDVLVLKPNEAFWIQRKELHGE